MSGALQAVFQNQRSFGAPPGQQAYTTPGTYSWVAPTGVTKVSVVAIGGGAGGSSNSYGGGGGGLGYKNNITVTPGSSYSVRVGSGGPQSVNGGASYFVCSSLVFGGNGYSCGSAGSHTGDGGGNGGTGYSGGRNGGGGAGG